MADMLIEDEDGYMYDEDKMGMRVTSGTVKIHKDEGNLIGISIGGGAPNCPCLYIVQVFDNTPVAKNGTLEAGDEITSVNGKCVKGSTKVEVARLIQSIKEEVVIGYNKLHADQKQGKTLDIILKKLKHKMVENMSSATADALGLSRAILCNDSLVKKLQELNRNEYIFKGLINHINYMIKAYYDLVITYKDFGDVFADIGAHEPQTEASKSFTKFGDMHRSFEKEGSKLINDLKPVLGDLDTYLNKAIPDTRLTIKKYADTKFEYLSYCLKVKEMDDEEYTYQALQEPLYRVETGNYEYRLVLRCRQEARKRFAQLRSDVLVKLELLDQKHVHNMATQITKFISALATFNQNCHSHLSENTLFPIELDLSKSCLLQSTGETATVDEYHDEPEDELIVPAEFAMALNDRDLDLTENANNADTADKEDSCNRTTTSGVANSASEIQNLIDIFGELSSAVNATASQSQNNGGQQPSSDLSSCQSADPSDLLLF